MAAALRSSAAFALSAVAALFCPSGCRPQPALPTPDELRAAVSYAVLQPELTCAALRDSYNLDNFPVVDTPDQVGMPYAENYVPAPRGALLRTWCIPALGERGLAVVSPGNSGSMACYLYTAKLLTDRGWSAVLYDYEGFGGSTGTPALEFLRDDLSTVLEWTLTYTGAPQVTLVGMSFGSIPAVALAVQRPDVVNGVVLDSPIAMGAEIERFSALIGGVGRAREIIDVLEPWLLTEEIIGNLHQPVLIFGHEHDIVTPPAAVQLIYDRAAGPKELLTFAGLGHAAGQFLRTDVYAAHLDSFLTRVWMPTGE